MDAAQAFHKHLESHRTAFTANQLKKQRKKRARLFKQAATSGLVDICTPSRPLMEDEREGSVARAIADGIQDVACNSDATVCKELPLLSTRVADEHMPVTAAAASSSFNSTEPSDPQQQPVPKRLRLTKYHNMKPLHACQGRHVDARANRGDYSAVMRALQHQVFSESQEQQPPDDTQREEVTSAAATATTGATDDLSLLQAGVQLQRAGPAGTGAPAGSKGPCRSDLSGQLAVINQQLSSEHSSSSVVHHLADSSAVDDGGLQHTQQQQQSGQLQAPRKRNRPSCLYGNYHHYYGYRIGPSGFEDPRMKVLSPDWFQGADVLDVGCNEGLLTLALAVGCGCRSMLGVDIDPVLVAKACTNLSRSRTQLTQQFREAVAARNARAGRRLELPPFSEGQQALSGPLGVIAASSAAISDSGTCRNNSCSSTNNTVAMSTSNRTPPTLTVGGDSSSSDGGSITSSSTCQQSGLLQEQANWQQVEQQQQQHLQGPKQRSLQGQVVQLDRQLKAISKVSFKCGNWLEMNSAANKYGVVTCFSVTKWIHLNWGDDGVMKLFHKFFRCLVPGGLLILEPQPFKSYQSAVHKAGVQSVQFKKISQLKLRPEGFCEFLTQRVGFELVQQLNAVSQVAGEGAVPVKGFDRPMLVLRKPAQ